MNWKKLERVWFTDAPPIIIVEYKLDNLSIISIHVVIFVYQAATPGLTADQHIHWTISRWCEFSLRADGGIAFTYSVQIDRRAAGKCSFGLYLRNRKM